jgi:hypothetical protein
MMEHVDHHNTVIAAEALDTLAAEREPHLQPLVFGRAGPLYRVYRHALTG